MRRLILIVVAAIAALGIMAVAAAAPPDVTLSGAYVPSTNRVAYQVDGNRAGRDLAVRHECDNGYTFTNRVYWNNPHAAVVNFSTGGGGATECTGVVIDLVDPLDSGTWVEVSNTVVIAIP